MTSLYAVLPVWAVLVYHVASHCDILNPEPAFSDTVSNTSVIFSGQRLLGQCYHKCLANLRCMSFTQNKGSGQCWTYSIGFLQPTNFMPSSGSEYYRLTTGKCDRSLGYMQDRELGLCFRMVKYSGERNISTIRSVCNDGMGGRLLVVNDEQKQKLIERTMDVNHGENRKGHSSQRSRSFAEKNISWLFGVTCIACIVHVMQVAKRLKMENRIHNLRWHKKRRPID